jgi:hypothetical protein
MFVRQRRSGGGLRCSQARPDPPRQGPLSRARQNLGYEQLEQQPRTVAQIDPHLSPDEVLLLIDARISVSAIMLRIW